MLKKHSEQDRSSWTLYRTCNKLPLDKFIECFCDNNYEVLIISGNPPTEELLLAWRELYSEFTDMMKDENHMYIRDTVDKINIITGKIEFGKAVIKYLQSEFREDIVSMLKSLGISIKLNPDNLVEYFKGVKRIVVQVKKWMVDLEECHIELSRAQEKNIQEGTNYDFFYDTLNAISKYNGYAVKPCDIVVAQFCKMVLRLKEANQKQQLKNGNS